MVAVCDQDLERAKSRASQFDVPGVFSDLERMFLDAGLDFVDIVTQVNSHEALVTLAAKHRVPVICQKPLAPDLAAASRMVNACIESETPFMVHENFRWQTPMRAAKRAAESIGDVHYARFSFRSGFDVYASQPYLATEERFILADLGVHLFDIVRYFMGEVRQLTCSTARVNSKIRGEDLAITHLQMTSGAICTVELSYAAIQEFEPFPQTFVVLEGSEGTVVLDRDFKLTTMRRGEVSTEIACPPSRAWFTPPGEVVQDSVFNIQRHWRDCLLDQAVPETSGEDNVKTLALVFGAYESAASGRPFVVNE